MKTNNTLLSACIGFVLMTSYAHAGVDDAMNTMFSGMTNVTEPQAFETINSIGVYGGRVVSKNKIISENLINFTPPSLKGGCGGIDLFAGSFSFIDSEHLAKLGEAVVSNAGSYATYLGLKAALPGPFQLLQELQKKIQDMNAALGNSCQIAQGLVNATGLPDALASQEANQNKTALNAKGVTSDFFSAMKSGSTQSQARASIPAEVTEKSGNLIWKQINKSSARVLGGSFDSEFSRAIMSLTGSVIVNPNTSSDPATGSDTTSKITIMEPTITLAQLVAGGKLSLVTCTDGYGENQCLTPGAPTDVNISSFSSRIINLLNGDGSNAGAIDKLADLNEGALTNEQKALIANMPFLSNTAIKSLSTKSAPAAKEYVAALSRAIALNLARDFAMQMFNSAEKSLATNKSVYAPQASEQLKQNRQKIENEYSALVNEYGSITQVLDTYKGLVEFLQTTGVVKTPNGSSGNNIKYKPES